MWKRLHLKKSLFLSYFNGTWISLTYFRKISNIKHYQKPFTKSRVVPYRRTDRQTGKTKLIVAFRNCVKAPENYQLMLYSEIIAVCSQIHTKHTNTPCGQNAEFLYVKHCGTYSNHWTLRADSVVEICYPTRATSYRCNQQPKNKTLGNPTLWMSLVRAAVLNSTHVQLVRTH
jgi:hypothetical protein